MQITERTDVGLNTARITLEAAGKPTITLFPMIHVADRDFFELVRDDAARHDLVLREGVNARPAWIANRSFRLVAGGAAGLSFQGDHMPVNSLGHSRLADMDGAIFMQKWRALPLWFRLAAIIMLPAAWLFLRFRGARRWIAEEMTDHDAHATAEDILPGDGAVGQLRKLLLTERDAILAAHCDHAIDEGGADTIAVVYGAAHMPALMRHLVRTQRYRATGSRWMLAIAA